MLVKVLPALAVLALAVLVGQWWPAAGGVLAMLPIKVAGYALAMSGDGREAVHAGAAGMLAGTLCITVPVLLLLWWWTLP